jgi:serine/threonine protein kinase
MRRPILDTSEFFDIDAGDEIHVGNRIFRVTGYERERRFGSEDPKFWVKRVIETSTNDRKIIKLAFFEKFETILGGIKILCFRDPDKESRVLEITRKNPFFMQGVTLRDSKNNNIRVLDIVRGTNLHVYLENLFMDHRTYFYTVFPDMLKQLISSFEALKLLHDQGIRHGDVRNDHLIIEGETGNYVWIDFDYDFVTPENPFSLDLFGLGNILLYTAGKGFHELNTILDDQERYGNLKHRLSADDFSIMYKSRFMNLRKIFPYIPEILNNALLHFTRGAELTYEHIDEIIEDLHQVTIH